MTNNYGQKTQVFQILNSKSMNFFAKLYSSFLQELPVLMIPQQIPQNNFEYSFCHTVSVLNQKLFFPTKTWIDFCRNHSNLFCIVLKKAHATQRPGCFIVAGASTHHQTTSISCQNTNRGSLAESLLASTLRYTLPNLSSVVSKPNLPKPWPGPITIWSNNSKHTGTWSAWARIATQASGLQSTTWRQACMATGTVKEQFFYICFDKQEVDHSKEPGTSWTLLVTAIQWLKAIQWRQAAVAAKKHSMLHLVDC